MHKTNNIFIMIVVVAVTLLAVNPEVALSYNPIAYPPEYDPEEDYTDKECAEMFPIYSEGYYSCTGGIGRPNPGP